MAGLFHHICLLKRIKFMQLVGKVERLDGRIVGPKKLYQEQGTSLSVASQKTNTFGIWGKNKNVQQ
jgi:hypothetical protein